MALISRPSFVIFGLIYLIGSPTLILASRNTLLKELMVMNRKENDQKKLPVQSENSNQSHSSSDEDHLSQSANNMKPNIGKSTQFFHLNPGNDIHPLKDKDEDSMDFEDINTRAKLDRWRPCQMFANVIYIFLGVTGCYLCFFGFYSAKISLSFLSLAVSYYAIIFFSCQLNVYDSENISHQLGIFFGTIFMGFTLSIGCFFFRSTQSMVLGVSLSSAICLLLLQFFIDFSLLSYKFIFISVYSVVSLLAFIMAIIKPKSSMMLISAVSGSIFACINTGVLIQKIESFDQRSTISEDALETGIPFIVACLSGVGLGLLLQYILKSKIGKDKIQGRLRNPSHAYLINTSTFL